MVLSRWVLRVASSLCETTVLYYDYFGTQLLFSIRVHVPSCSLCGWLSAWCVLASWYTVVRALLDYPATMAFVAGFRLIRTGVVRFFLMFAYWLGLKNIKAPEPLGGRGRWQWHPGGSLWPGCMLHQMLSLLLFLYS